MKKIVTAVGLVLIVSSVAFAEWLVDFKNTFFNEGIDKAVVVAMEEGVRPELIVENGLQLEGLNPANLIKALYCAGAKGQDIRQAAENSDISEVIIVAGYKKSIAECGDKVAEAQPFTPVATATSFVSVDGGGGGGPVSPSAFTQ